MCACDYMNTWYWTDAEIALNMNACSECVCLSLLSARACIYLANSKIRQNTNTSIPIVGYGLFRGSVCSFWESVRRNRSHKIFFAYVPTSIVL